MRYGFAALAIFFMSASASFCLPTQALAAGGDTESCELFLNLTPGDQEISSEAAFGLEREDAVWACHEALHPNLSAREQPFVATETWQCIARGQERPTSHTGTGSGSSQSQAQSHALSSCRMYGAVCRVSSCSSRRSGSTTSWTCYAVGEKPGRTVTFTGRKAEDRRHAQDYALSECSRRAISCSIESCRQR